MCMGKGGVGKTTIAAAIAVALAHRGHQVHLTTTDPAGHLDGHPDGEPGQPDGVAASTRPRPPRVPRRVLATKGAGLDEQGRAGLAEDLRSPCTEEVAVFQAFSQDHPRATRRVRRRRHRPTGTPCCCSTPPAPTTARSSASWAEATTSRHR